jgi:hypothetical protein
VPKATYSEKLLEDIRNGVWRESELDLSQQKPKLDEKAVQQLANALATSPSINTLNLYGNKIGDAGAIALAKNTRLTLLHIGGNKIGEAGAAMLAKNTTLTSL